jgi:Flp pilus assembly pilin Flp
MATAIMRMRALVHDDDGQDLMEYALLAALISLVAVATVRAAGQQVSPFYDAIVDELAAAVRR